MAKPRRSQDASGERMIAGSARPRPRWVLAGGNLAGIAALAALAVLVSVPPGWTTAFQGGEAIRTAADTAMATGPVLRAQSPAEVKVGAPAPDIVFTTIEGTRHQLSEFRGRPVMLWFFATWCPTCLVGTKVMAENFDSVKETGIQIVQLRLYNNLGFRGPSVEDVATRYAGDAYPSSRWLWGEASRIASFTYDPRGYPDVYFLIDDEGIVRDADTAPHVTLDKILAFARGAS